MNITEDFLKAFESLDAKNKGKMIAIIQILNEVEKLRNKAKALGVILEVKLRFQDSKTY